MSDRRKRLEDILNGAPWPVPVTWRVEVEPAIEPVGAVRVVASWGDEERWWYGDFEAADPDQLILGASICGFGQRIFAGTFEHVRKALNTSK